MMNLFSINLRNKLLKNYFNEETDYFTFTIVNFLCLKKTGKEWRNLFAKYFNFKLLLPLQWHKNQCYILNNNQFYLSNRKDCDLEFYANDYIRCREFSLYDIDRLVHVYGWDYNFFSIKEEEKNIYLKALYKKRQNLYEEYLQLLYKIAFNFDYVINRKAMIYIEMLHGKYLKNYYIDKFFEECLNTNYLSYHNSYSDYFFYNEKWIIYNLPIKKLYENYNQTTYLIRWFSSICKCKSYFFMLEYVQKIHYILDMIIFNIDNNKNAYDIKMKDHIYRVKSFFNAKIIDVLINKNNNSLDIDFNNKYIIKLINLLLNTTVISRLQLEKLADSVSDRFLSYNLYNSAFIKAENEEASNLVLKRLMNKMNRNQ